MMDRLAIADMRYLNASTSEKYVHSYCKSQGLEPKTLEVDTDKGGAVAHWIGDPDADAVILYCHGGGYTQPANEGNFRHLSGIVKDVNNDVTKPSVAVLLLSYTLVPEAVFPTQLREALVVLRHLIYDTGRSPTNIFLAGDSAGGNLALSVLSHILHPHPDVFALKLEEPLGGALLLSPWVGFRTDYPSFKSNETLDMLGSIALRKWSAMFLDKASSSNPEEDPGLTSGDAWTEPCLNPSSWWNNMHRVVSDVFIWCGGYEVLLDSIHELENNFMAGWESGGGDPSRIICAESAKQSHVAPMVDTMIPGAKKGDAQVAIEEWLKGRIQLRMRSPAQRDH